MKLRIRKNTACNLRGAHLQLQLDLRRIPLHFIPPNVIYISRKILLKKSKGTRERVLGMKLLTFFLFDHSQDNCRRLSNGMTWLFRLVGWI